MNGAPPWPSVFRSSSKTTLTAAPQTRPCLSVLTDVYKRQGVATHTRRWADRLDGTGAMVIDTRKTTPGMRHLVQYAVLAGGGTNKRMGLYDVVMMKDNHKKIGRAPV